MENPVPDRWPDDLVVLKAVVDLAGTGQITLPEEIVEHLGQSTEDVQASLFRLSRADPPFAEFNVSATYGSGYEVHAVSLPTERALRTAEVWTSAEAALDRIANALEATLDQAATEEDRTRIQKMVAWFRGGARDALIQALGVGLQIGLTGLGGSGG